MLLESLLLSVQPTFVQVFLKLLIKATLFGGLPVLLFRWAYKRFEKPDFKLLYYFSLGILLYCTVVKFILLYALYGMDAGRHELHLVFFINLYVGFIYYIQSRKTIEEHTKAKIRIGMSTGVVLLFLLFSTYSLSEFNSIYRNKYITLDKDVYLKRDEDKVYFYKAISYSAEKPVEIFSLAVTDRWLCGIGTDSLYKTYSSVSGMEIAHKGSLDTLYYLFNKEDHIGYSIMNRDDYYGMIKHHPDIPITGFHDFDWHLEHSEKWLIRWFLY